MPKYILTYYHNNGNILHLETATFKDKREALIACFRRHAEKRVRGTAYITSRLSVSAQRDLEVFKGSQNPVPAIENRTIEYKGFTIFIINGMFKIIRQGKTLASFETIEQAFRLIDSYR